MNKKTGNKVIILVNTGTPDSFETKDVRRYLSEFLNDKYVIDIPWLWRKLLVNLIIVPFRAPKSAALYRKLWTVKGSPLKIYLDNLVKKVQTIVPAAYKVEGAFRYGNPSLKNILGKYKDCPPDQLIIFPLFPQYASSTSGSIAGLSENELKNWKIKPEVRIVGQFYSHPAYVNTLTDHVASYNPGNFDFVLFSYHGLPLRQINKIHPEKDSVSCSCTGTMPDYGKQCYKATCYEQSRILAEKLHLEAGKWGTSFQSRLTKNWISPFSDSVIKELALSGKKKILVVAPSFVSDCLETIIEINEEYRHIFTENGGEEFVLVSGLNDVDNWAQAVNEIIFLSRQLAPEFS